MSNTLQSGDILVFKAGNDWVGRSIAFLTKSDVSHAAMVYEGDFLVEMAASGIHVGRIKASPGNQAYVMRLNPRRDAQPLIDAANAYINSRTHYDFPSLVILAGLLIYRNVRPTPKFVKITDLILRAACKEVDKLIQRLVLHNPDKAMVCSQLVYQIYRDCGKDYEIQLTGGDLQAGRNDYADGSVRLIELLKERPDRCQNNLLWESDEKFTAPPEKLARQLYEAMTDYNENDLDTVTNSSLDSLLDIAEKLLEKLEKLLETAGYDIPIDALFVTPDDLVYHAKNLVQVQTVDIERIKE